jgi:hypothetical protein
MPKITFLRPDAVDAHARIDITHTLVETGDIRAVSARRV